jgi:hypothetical protein
MEDEMNGKRILGAALITSAMAAVSAVSAAAADLWLHVKVDGGQHGEQATINLPLSMVDTFAPMISEKAHGGGRIRIKDHDYNVARLKQAWRQIENGPDATFVTVEEPDSKVRIAKRSGFLVLEATEREEGEQVEARIPLRVMRALLSGPEDELDVGAALQALAQEGAGELITVNGRDETVRIWVDAISETR